MAWKIRKIQRDLEGRGGGSILRGVGDKEGGGVVGGVVEGGGFRDAAEEEVDGAAVVHCGDDVGQGVALPEALDEGGEDPGSQGEGVADIGRADEIDPGKAGVPGFPEVAVGTASEVAEDLAADVEAVQALASALDEQDAVAEILQDDVGWRKVLAGDGEHVAAHPQRFFGAGAIEDDAAADMGVSEIQHQVVLGKGPEEVVAGAKPSDGNRGSGGFGTGAGQGGQAGVVVRMNAVDADGDGAVVGKFTIGPLRGESPIRRREAVGRGFIREGSAGCSAGFFAGGAEGEIKVHVFAGGDEPPRAQRLSGAGASDSGFHGRFDPRPEGEAGESAEEEEEEGGVAPSEGVGWRRKGHGAESCPFR